MGSYNRLYKITGWLVFAIALTVYFFSAERTGSLWDCGEFILGANKLQVVHPPGAPLFLLIGRLFTWVAEILSDNPEDIAFAVNMMSGICSAFAAGFIAWVTMMLGKLALVGRNEETDTGQNIALAGAGLAAGLSTAFATSVWFSAVEGEVYAMSTFFTTLTLWSMIRWYTLPDTPKADRWLFFTIYAAGLSTGVHLLSLLTFPALAMFYYFKKYKTITWKGIALAAGAGVLIIAAVQKLIIVGIPTLWSWMEMFTVNTLGLPFHSGLIPTLLIIGGILYYALYYAQKNNNALVQNLAVSALLLIIAFSTIGVVVVRANADPPINMNRPSDAMRLIPYLNREQYGERALLYGPDFDARPSNTELSDRYGRVGDRYAVTDYKIDVEYDSRDKMLLPRMGDGTQGRPRYYKQWMGLNPDGPLPDGRPNQIDNVSFFLRYQFGWMYWRYFMWNFSGRQNGEQGYEPWDKSSGHWITGIKFLDAIRLGPQAELPERQLDNKARNTYFALPFLFGLLGIFFHFKNRSNDALGLLALFVITGIGIIIYSNQPPREPRERDYVLVGSIFTYCIWIGMAVLALFRLLQNRLKQSGPVAAGVAAAIVLIAPLLMGFQNFDDHSRRYHKASRDYASNFLNSVEENAIIFTYGDNDTYPLWYAQEVEGIRTDVRVVNLSLIAVDWYIDLLRRKVNDSPAIKMTIPQEGYRGNKRTQVFFNNRANTPFTNRPVDLQQFMQLIAQPRQVPLVGGRFAEGFYETDQVYMNVNREEVLANNVVPPELANQIVSQIPINIQNRSQLIKDDVAILDILASNLWERPIYFAVTCRPEKFFGMDDYMQLEGLALRLVPVRSQSDRVYGVLGSGRVATDKLFENITEKFRWGNFDTHESYVDRSYMPSLQSMQFAMRRGAFAMLAEGKKEQAIQLVDQYFEAFPAMNFPYDYRTLTMLDVYFQAGEYEKAKPHMEILAQSTYDFLEYIDSLDQATLNSYEGEFGAFFNVMERLLNEASRAGDSAYRQELNNLFGSLSFFNEVNAPDMPATPQVLDTPQDTAPQPISIDPSDTTIN
ncbi:glycosyltransferase family 117 protein [Flavilitoribacter nigricans]|uniref:Membrane protein n=1 Tax=Flavilitoribacter nigricans (strain ATCC 23147 / DSM 23189 / NBRC 102662 / NCIMB 1420 / SS-2) TaxID=1122177 RepID=A0A2D0NBA2_FLAN2|nr:DUF2723 domain-containing protein [Flavilitoribacter nigricans]PHN05449.1 membrane protein [Flavilitoribacter nigricans DSM 23189 = NBRC 102662]